MIELYSSEIELHFFGAIFMKIRIVEFVDIFLLKISLADIFQGILKLIFLFSFRRHWVVGKNAELEKARAQGKYMKPFETDILKLRADELNYTLCMFVKEVRKPNGEPYASDSILYLTLGIQGELTKHYWYFVSKIVLTYCEKKNWFFCQEKLFQIRG